MLTTKTRNEHYTETHATEPVLFLAFHQARLLHAVAQAKRRFGLPDTAPMVRGYEAAREGFWPYCFLQAQGITSYVVDSSAIEVNRRKRRAKSDGLDVRQAGNSDDGYARHMY